MEFTPEHKMEFEVVGNDNIEIQPVKNPSYVYKVGEKIKVFYIDIKDNAPDEKQAVFEVTDIQHEINQVLFSEQRIVVYLKME